MSQRQLALALGLFLIWVSPLAADESETPRESAETAAERIVNTMIAGWNASDGKAFAAPFAEDATYRVWNGLFSEGRHGIAATHQGVFGSIFAGTELQLEIERVRSLTADVALAYIRGRVLRDGERLEQLPGMDGAVPVLVLVHDGDNWMAAHFQNTPDLMSSRSGGPPPARE